MLCSVAGMVLTSGLLAFGLDGHHPYLSGFAIIAFIVGIAYFLLASPFVPHIQAPPVGRQIKA